MNELVDGGPGHLAAIAFARRGKEEEARLVAGDEMVEEGGVEAMAAFERVLGGEVRLHAEVERRVAEGEIEIDEENALSRAEGGGDGEVGGDGSGAGSTFGAEEDTETRESVIRGCGDSRTGACHGLIDLVMGQREGEDFAGAGAHGANDEIGGEVAGGNQDNSIADAAEALDEFQGSFRFAVEVEDVDAVADPGDEGNLFEGRIAGDLPNHEEGKRKGADELRLVLLIGADDGDAD